MHTKLNRRSNNAEKYKKQNAHKAKDCAVVFGVKNLLYKDVNCQVI
jgi:hypothetical protein